MYRITVSLLVSLFVYSHAVASGVGEKILTASSSSTTSQLLPPEAQNNAHKGEVLIYTLPEQLEKLNALTPETLDDGVELFPSALLFKINHYIETHPKLTQSDRGDLTEHLVFSTLFFLEMVEVTEFSRDAIDLVISLIKKLDAKKLPKQKANLLKKSFRNAAKVKTLKTSDIYKAFFPNSMPLIQDCFQHLKCILATHCNVQISGKSSPFFTESVVRENRKALEQGVNFDVVTSKAKFWQEMLAAQIRTVLVSAPKIAQDLEARPFKGEVISFQETDKGPRLVMQPTYIQGLEEAELPRYIKVIINKQAAGEVFMPGDIIRVWGFLKPPLGLAFKGAYDFERQNYFKQIGGVGFALSKPQLIERPKEGAWTHRVETMRSAVTDKIYDALPGETGGVAAALITGHKEKIPEETYEAYRNAGLAHLLAISGLHFGLIFGFIFFSIRFVLVLIPGFALRFPVKKSAILVALFGAFCYSVLAGGSVPTMRSFIMLGLFSFAVLLDRLALSMYNVAWAAVIIMLIMPEALLGASFQMSFAAVIALIALYENGMAGERVKDHGYLWRIIAYVVVLAGTSLVAGFATMPYTIFHFGQFQPYGVAANLIAIPLTGIWIMPIALVALLLMPFGLETWPLKAMGEGIEIVTKVAKTVASWDFSVILVPQFKGVEIGLITLGALWFFIWQQKWRYAGALPIIVGFVMLLTHDRPDLFIGQKGKMLAVRTDEGLFVTSVKRQAFTRKQWMVAAGCESESCFPYSNRKRDDRYALEGSKMKCDYLGCVAELDGRLVAIPRRVEALYKDCTKADVILISVQHHNTCPEKTTEMPQFDTGMGYVSEAGIKWVMPKKVARPWRN